MASGPVVIRYRPARGREPSCTGMNIAESVDSVHSNGIAKEAIMPTTKKPNKQTSPRISSLASDVLAGRTKPTPKQVRSLAASALGQDETKGQRPSKRR